MKKIYIAGPITGLPPERVKAHFGEAEKYLIQEGFTVLNPTVLPAGLEHDEYMQICFIMLDVCDGIYLLDGWEKSKGAKMEFERSINTRRQIFYEGDI